jgi:hypothetical protein
MKFSHIILRKVDGMKSKQISNTAIPTQSENELIQNIATLVDVK